VNPACASSPSVMPSPKKANTTVAKPVLLAMLAKKVALKAAVAVVANA
jgi:hypothetical protein